MPDQPLVLRYAARSDVGLVRAKNDDSAYAGQYLAVVADGMGGHAGGDVASASTILDLIHLDHANHADDAGAHLADEIQTANSLLSELVHVNPKLAGMGTTVTALLLSGERFAYAHIGDSRAYRLKDGVFAQMSTDHTFVQRMIDEGRMTEAEAEVHPHKNVLMRVLGDVDASPELDLQYFPVTAGERWLLCSDGLNFVRHEMIEEVIRNTTSLAAAAETLIQLTLAAGSPDNVTVVVVDIVQDAPSSEALDPVTATLAGLPSDPPVTRTDAPDAAAPPASDGTPALSEEAADGDAGLRDGQTPDLDAHIRAAVIRHELSKRPHELVGAAVTANAEGKIPSLARRPAEQRAAQLLTHKTNPTATLVDEAETSIPRTRWRPLAVAIISAVLVLLIAGGAWAAYAWTQTQFYVGVSNSNVAIFKGVSQNLGPLSLSALEHETPIPVDALPAYSQQLVARTMPSSSLEGAEQIIRDLQLGTGSSIPPCELAPSPATASATASTATPGPTTAGPTTSSSAAPAPSCNPGGEP